MTNLISVLEDKKFVINSMIIKVAVSHKLSLSEFLLLIYFDNDFSKSLNIDAINEIFGLSKEDILSSFNSLMEKELIELATVKDSSGSISDKVSLNGLYKSINEEISNKSKKENTENIFSTFEHEFGRPLSSMEYEIINAWIEKGISEELIKGALKEAVYNGVPKLRYIDKIVFEWSKLGFKTIDEVNDYVSNKNKGKKDSSTPLFDYDWLDDNEE